MTTSDSSRLTPEDLAEIEADEAAQRADRKLLAETLRWARLNGYRRSREFEMGRFSGYSWDVPYQTVHFDPGGDTTIYVDKSAITADTAREAVDVLCALGVLPAHLSSLYGRGRDDEAAGV